MVNNPLAKHFRQPKLYVRLPSRGLFYPDGAIAITENGEYPVLAMTAKDELMFKTPDALLNGQSTVNVIQSCMPNIKDAWKIPSIDIDAILIAIRIATYGEQMDLTFTIPNTGEERVYALDLRILLDQLNANEYDNVIRYNDFKFEIAPLNYKSFTETAIKTFEEQRLFKVINDQSMNELEKLSLFNESFNRLTDINISQVAKSVKSIQFDGEDPVTNSEHILEFFANADKDVFKTIINHIDEQKKKFTVQPLTIKTTEEDQAKGAPASFNVPIMFDQSNFFE